mgnify:CR=1 FL=1
MYEAYFGLRGKPFQLNPDPSFFYGSRGHRRAMAYLEYGLHQNEGFIVITGEIGAGKTTVLRLIGRQLSPLSGQVMFDGQDLVRFGKAWLEARFGQQAQRSIR